MERRFILTAAIFGIISIILGAFGAHALKNYLTTQELISFETGVRYQMYHAFFLFFVATQKELAQKSKQLIYSLTLAGVLLFSGSIYLLSTSAVSGINFKIIGFVTPIGGFLLIFAWITLLTTIFRQKS